MNDFNEKEIHIRPMTFDDIGQIEDIQRQILRKDVSSTWIESVKHHIAKEDDLSLVAEVDDKIVGFIIGDIKSGHFGLEKSGWIEMVGVLPRLMGQGIGKGLAGKLFDLFKKNGITDIYTAVRWDAGDMLAFFKSLGFDRSNFINLRKKLKNF